MGSGLIKALAFIVAVILGTGLTYFFWLNVPLAKTFSTLQLVLIGAGLTLAAFIALYFATKSSS